MNYSDLENCKLCAWDCGVNRLVGEQGVCLMGVPGVANYRLHPAPPQSYTVFTSGINSLMNGNVMHIYAKCL